jgi:hypothetical protein
MYSSFLKLSQRQLIAPDNEHWEHEHIHAGAPMLLLSILVLVKYINQEVQKKR